MTRPIAESLQGASQLSSLLQRVQASQARLDDVRAILPQALGRQISAGPLDDEGWTLLAASPAVAAKLRQLMPDIEDHLRGRGWPVVALRLRIAGSALG